jgi:2-iminoacetate synthase ThiH
VPEEIAADAVEIVARDGEHMTVVGGELVDERIESLEALAEEDFESYFLEATRIDERFWEVTVNAL